MQGELNPQTPRPCLQRLPLPGPPWFPSAGNLENEKAAVQEEMEEREPKFISEFGQIRWL